MSITHERLWPGKMSVWSAKQDPLHSRQVTGKHRKAKSKACKPTSNTLSSADIAGSEVIFMLDPQLEDSYGQ
jgi:hypothetical protein